MSNIGAREPKLRGPRVHDPPGNFENLSTLGCILVHLKAKICQTPGFHCGQQSKKTLNDVSQLIKTTDQTFLKKYQLSLCFSVQYMF